MSSIFGQWWFLNCFRWKHVCEFLRAKFLIVSSFICQLKLFMFCSTPTLIAAHFLNLNSFPVATFQFQRERNKNEIFTKVITCKQMLFCDQNHQHFNQYFDARTRNTISHTCHSTSVVSKRVQKSSKGVSLPSRRWAFFAHLP